MLAVQGLGPRFEPVGSSAVRFVGLSIQRGLCLPGPSLYPQIGVHGPN